MMVDLLPRLRDRGLDVSLLIFDGTDTPFRKAVERVGIKIYDLGKGGSVYSLRRLWGMRKFLRQFDVLHTHNTAPQLFAAIWNLFGGATLCTTEHNTSNRRRAWKWYRPIDIWMYSRYSRVICISKKAEENLRDFISCRDSKILTVNNGIDVGKISSARPGRTFAGIAPDCRMILMVAAFRWEKDQDTIIRAMKQLPESFHLFLVGDGVRRKDCEALAEAEAVSPRVHFLGLRTDVPSLLHEADYIVMSSHFEGLSLSSVEGMAAGKPMLASDVDGLREVVGGAGILFPHQDAEALANEILRLETSPEEYSRVASACTCKAKDYDITKMTEGYIKVYDQIRLNG